MRKSRGRTLLFAALVLSACVLVESVLPARAGRMSEPPQNQGSPFFTPAHPSVPEAIRDFFNRRRPPTQPVAFAHQVHLAKGMQCDQCHAGVDRGPDAVIPGVNSCMACHRVAARDRPEIRKVAAYSARGEEIPWEQVYSFSHSAHLKFNHAAHLRAKVACVSCHGDMRQETTAQPLVNLTMGYCVGCHQQREASVECVTCHY